MTNRGTSHPHPTETGQAARPVKVRSEHASKTGRITTAIWPVPNKRTRQTRSRKAATDPSVKARLHELEIEWSFLTSAEKLERIQSLAAEGISYRAIALAIGKAPNTILNIVPVSVRNSRRSSSKQARRKGPPQKRDSRPRQAAAPQQASSPAKGEEEEPVQPQEPADQLSRLADVLAAFFSGKYGTPLLTRQEINRVLTQVDLSYSNQLFYEPARAFEIPANAESEAIIQMTKPGSGDIVSWLASIRVSLKADPLVWHQALVRALGLM